MSKRRLYSSEDLKKAIADIKSRRLSYGEAARVYTIPKTTLHDQTAGKYDSSVPGPSGELTTDEETALVNYIVYVAERGFPITRKLLKNLVIGIIKESGRTSLINLNKGPSQEWCRKFLKRHPHLTEKSPEAQNKGQSRMSNSTVMQQYFDLLDNTINNLGLHDKGSQIFNCDESGFSGKEKSRQKVVAVKGRHAYQQTSLASSHVTLHLCIGADGRVLPSFVIFKGGFPHRQFKEGVPSSWLFGTSPSGYMDGELFENWFLNIFIQNCGIKRPVLLIMDNHDSHFTLPLLKSAIENNVCILGLPPHTTHILQPLDVAIFGPLKEKVSSLAAATGYLSSAVIGKSKFPALLSTAIYSICTPARIKSGFSKCGIFPVNRDAIDKSQLIPPDTCNNSKVKQTVGGVSSVTHESTNNSITVLCDSCGTTMDVGGLIPSPPINPLLLQGLIPDNLKNVLVPPPGQSQEKKRSAKIVTEARVLTGEDIIRHLEMKEEEAKRKEEEKELRRIERIKRREEKERIEADKRMRARQKKDERERKKMTKARQQLRKANNVDLCVMCYEVEPVLGEEEEIVEWVQCNMCEGWAHKSCAGDVCDNDEYICDECHALIEE